MKLRFCGGGEAPDWLLGQLVVLVKLSSVRVSLLCDCVVHYLLTEQFQESKINDLLIGRRLQYTQEDKKTLFSILCYIIKNAAGFSVDSEHLFVELEQIGIPQDISKVICSKFSKFKDQLRDSFADRLPSPSMFSKMDWRIDSIIDSSSLSRPQTPSIRLRFVDQQRRHHCTILSLSQFRCLHSDLRYCQRQFQA